MALPRLANVLAEMERHTPFVGAGAAFRKAFEEARRHYDPSDPFSEVKRNGWPQGDEEEDVD